MPEAGYCQAIDAIKMNAMSAPADRQPGSYSIPSRVTFRQFRGSTAPRWLRSPR